MPWRRDPVHQVESRDRSPAREDAVTMMTFAIALLITMVSLGASAFAQQPTKFNEAPMLAERTI